MRATSFRSVVVPLREGGPSQALVDEPHGNMTHLVRQRTPQLGPTVEHSGAQLDLRADAQGVPAVVRRLAFQVTDTR